MVTRNPYCSASRPTAARPSWGTSPRRETSSVDPPARASEAFSTASSGIPTPPSSISITAPLCTGIRVTYTWVLGGE